MCNSAKRNISSTYIAHIHLIGWIGSILNIFCDGPCNGAPPIQPPSAIPSPSIRISHHCLNGGSGGIQCAVFHYSPSSLHPAIFSACTHNCFTLSFILTKYIHCSSIYFRPATALTSNHLRCSGPFSDELLGELISAAQGTPSLCGNNVFSRLLSIKPVRSAACGGSNGSG